MAFILSSEDIYLYKMTQPAHFCKHLFSDSFTDFLYI